MNFPIQNRKTSNPYGLRQVIIKIEAARKNNTGGAVAWKCDHFEKTFDCNIANGPNFVCVKKSIDDLNKINFMQVIISGKDIYM